MVRFCMSIMDTVSAADHPVVLYVSDGRHRSDADLKVACRALTAPHYLSFETLFERDWAFCRQGCFIASQGRLTGYILAEVHETAGVGRTLFLGLSAGEADRVGRAETVKAYMLCLLKAARASPAIAWAWGTTISPIIFHAVSSYLADAAPRPDGAFDAVQGEVAASIVVDRACWGWPPPDAERPFALRGVSRSVRYSPSEQQRLAMMRSKVPVLGSWHLSEADGDRLLFVGRLPSLELIELLAKRVLRGCRLVDVCNHPSVN